jgi:hypothetical protein
MSFLRFSIRPTLLRRQDVGHSEQWRMSSVFEGGESFGEWLERSCGAGYRDDDEWALEAPQHSRESVTAGNQMLSGFSAGAQDDEVGVALGRLVEDFIGEEAGDDHGFDFDSGSLQWFGQRVQARLELGVAFGRKQRPRGSDGGALGFCSGEHGWFRFSDMEKHDIGREFLGELSGLVGEVSRGLFEIDCDQKGFLWHL